MINIDCIGDGTRIVSVTPKKVMKTEQHEKFTQILLDKSEKYGLIYSMSGLQMNPLKI